MAHTTQHQGKKMQFKNGQGKKKLKKNKNKNKE